MGSYLPSTQAERQAMLEAIGCQSVEELYAQVPPEMRVDRLDLPDGKSELEVRRMLSYPPFSRLVVITFRSRDKEQAEGGARTLADVVGRIVASSRLEDHVSIVGVSPCIIERKAGSWRYQLLLSSQRILMLEEVLRKALSLCSWPSSVHVEIDVDPLNLM